MLLTSDKDPMGAAILDYLAHRKASKLRVFSSMFDEARFPWTNYSGLSKKCPPWNRRPFNSVRAKYWMWVPEVGVTLQCRNSKEVTAIDISPLSVEAMNKRGVKDARLQNLTRA